MGDDETRRPPAPRKKYVLFSVKVAVFDEEAIRGRAREGWLATGGDPDEELSLGRSVLEALVLSNDNPAPLDLGVEIVGHETEEWEEPRPPAAAPGAAP